jgi:replication factor C large subunit
MKNDFLPWVQKYAPKNTKEHIGQELALESLRTFLKDFPKKRAAILSGPTGVGKTDAVYLIAKEHELELLEVNASDDRDKQAILAKVGEAAAQKSLFFKGKIILIDEVDSVSGRQDFGAIPAIISVIEKSRVPIIMTGNDVFDPKFSSLRSKSKIIECTPLDYTSIVKILKRICKTENLTCTEDVLARLARRSGGDARAAITDLQILSFGRKSIEKEDIDALSERKNTSSMAQALTKIFKSTDFALTINAFDDTDEDLDSVLLWMDENMPKEYQNPDDLARAFDELSKADIFRSRIRRRQEWRFLVYVNAFLSAGVALSKKHKYPTVQTYHESMRALRIWQLNQKNIAKKIVAEKLAEHLHISKKKAFMNMLPFIAKIARNANMKEKMAADLDLEIHHFDTFEVKL